MNSITWVGRTSKAFLTAEPVRAFFFHSKDQREVLRLTMEFDYGPFLFRIKAVRQENRSFHGSAEKYEHSTTKLLIKMPVAFCLLDSLGAHALTLSKEPWIQDDGEQCDWMGRFDSVRRVECES